MMQTLSEHLSKSPPSDLFHYTTINGFLGIVESRQLWATDIYYMNDTQELVYAANLVKEILSDMLKSHKHHSDLTKIFHGGIYNAQYANVFCTSFCESRDLISQWRGYGGDSGMAICFSPKKIIHIAQSNKLRLAQCIYDRATQIEIVSELCGDHVTEISKLIDSGADLNTGDAVQKFFRDLCYCGAILKNPTFSSENEWRIMSDVFDMVYTGNLPFVQMGFRAGRSTIIPYLKVNLDIDYANDDSDQRVDLGFHDILIGPTSVSELPWRALSNYLTARKIRYSQITPSGVPLRGAV